ncbi:MAG: hypothetical protein RL748_2295 [Pseudomonadota bacterium]
MLVKCLLLVCLALLQSACATRSSAPALYDFGPLASNIAPPAQVRLPALKVADAQAPAWMDGPLMFYRLGYANVQQAWPYATSRWSMSPAQLLTQRLKTRIAMEGATVLASGEGSASMPTLRLDADEFIQIFSSASSSSVQLSLRASLFQGNQLIGQKRFEQQVSAPSPDAAGGARALALASDAAISDILGWLVSLPVSK